MGLGLGMALEVYTSLLKGLKAKSTKFWEITLTFVNTGEKLVGDRVGFFVPPIQNKVNGDQIIRKFFEINYERQSKNSLQLKK